MTRKPSNSKHWFVCAYCPKKQFVMAKNKRQAEHRIEMRGWKTHPTKCPKCSQQPDVPYDFACDKCEALEVVHAPNIDAAVMALLKLNWTGQGTPGDWSNPAYTFRCPNCNEAARRKLKQNGEPL